MIAGAIIKMLKKLIKYDHYSDGDYLNILLIAAYTVYLVYILSRIYAKIC